MYINELTSKPNDKSITVTLTYEECRDIANGLYSTVSKEDNTGLKYRDIYGKCKFLFDMIKHGNIQTETIKWLVNKTEDIKAGENDAT